MNIIDSLKIRIHRVVFELLLFGVLVYFYGWLSLFVIFLVFLIEFVPATRLDAKINPWCRRHIEQHKRKQLEKEYARMHLDDDDDDECLDDNCPNCHREYDEIDREYQICHFCGHVNNPDF